MTYVGSPEEGDDIYSFDKAFETISSDHILTAYDYTFDRWWDFVSSYDYETVSTNNLNGNGPTVLLNSSIITEPDMPQWLLDNNWGQCVENWGDWCDANYLIM